MKRIAGSACCAGAGLADGSTAAPPIACTLDAGNFAERTAAIRDLARLWLRRAERTPQILTLDYNPAAGDILRDVVAKERQCCAFLRFDVAEADGAAILTIVAPVGAEDAAAVIFNEFCGGTTLSDPPAIQP